jgi:hypothetical protein
MPTVEVNVEIWCSCGEGLCNQSWSHEGGIQVEPCNKCLEKAKDDGYDEGHKEGFDKGYEKGVEEETEKIKNANP